MSFSERALELQAIIRNAHAHVHLKKQTSNLFRDRKKNAQSSALDVSSFNQLHHIDEEKVTVEGMMTYSELINHCLLHKRMPCVVPELKTITVGGAVSGIGIESSSFQFGLPHHSVEAMDILIGTGEIVECRADNEHSDLFFGFPNSYGTLGYALRLTLKLIPTQAFVHLEYQRCDNIEDFCTRVSLISSKKDADFLDGVCFRVDEIYLCIGRFTHKAPYTSNYRWMNIYYQSIRKRQEDYLSTFDYIWRWDTDWFWCSKNLAAQYKPIRFLATPALLNSRTYTRLMHLNSRLGLTKAMNKMRRLHTEAVIHDTALPLDKVPEFFDFYHREVGLLPLWLCPFKTGEKKFPLFALKGNQNYINFGFWDVFRSKKPFSSITRRIEVELKRLGGHKSLYSDSFYSEDEFYQTYGGTDYHALKRKYDPNGRFLNLFQKCVRAL